VDIGNVMYFNTLCWFNYKVRYIIIIHIISSRGLCNIYEVIYQETIDNNYDKGKGQSVIVMKKRNERRRSHLEPKHTWKPELLVVNDGGNPWVSSPGPIPAPL